MCKLRNQDDLMILCENHLIVLILASWKYNCSADEGGVLIQKWTGAFVKATLEAAVAKWQNFLFITFLISN